MIKPISIIISSYNSEKTILETLESVANQTYSNWECIIVDDGSTDNTIQVINDFILNKNQFTLIANNENTGKQPVVLNQGIVRSKYDYILILDSDDLLKDTCLENRIEKMNIDSDMNIFPNTILFKNTIGDMGKNKIVYNHESSNYLKDFIIHKLPTAWQVTNVLWKKESLNKIGNFNENMIRIVDVELSCRALIYDLKISVFSNEVADFFYRITSNSVDEKGKRMRFYKASTVFIKEISNFTNDHRKDKNNLVKEYLIKFYISVLSTTLISKEFDSSHVEDFISFGIKEDLVKESVFTKNILLIKKVSELPLIRNLIFHFTKFYIYS